MELTVYPNPSLRYINVPDSPHDQFIIISLNGAQSLSGPIPEERTIDLQEVPPGFYVLILTESENGKSDRYKICKSKDL